MRGLLTSAAALLLALSTQAFAQNAEPVLVDQGATQPASTPAEDGSTALAQAPPPGPFDNLTPWVVTGAVVGTVVTVAVVASQNSNNSNNNNNVSNKSHPSSP